jgi:hypothetical protein
MHACEHSSLHHTKAYFKTNDKQKPSTTMSGWLGLQSLAKKVGENVSSGLRDAKEGLVEGFSEAANEAANSFQDAKAAVKKREGLLDQVSSGLRGAKEGLVEGLSEAAVEAKAAVNKKDGLFKHAMKLADLDNLRSSLGDSTAKTPLSAKGYEPAPHPEVSSETKCSYLACCCLCC